MRRVSLVRRRDGEVVAFDENVVLESVHRALLACGREDRLLAGELASVVSLFLQKTFYDEVPTVEQVEDMVEKVLLETGHGAAAKAFILQRERELRLREARAVREEPAGPTLFEPGAIRVDDSVRGVSLPYSREALARVLAADGLLTRASADEVAAAVETRLRRAGLSRVPMALVRAVAESEILERRSDVDHRRRLPAVFDSSDVAAALDRRAGAGGTTRPSDAAREIGGAALRAHALAELLPAETARAHLDGDLFVHGLESGTALFAASLGPDDVKRGAAPGIGGRAPERAGDGARRLTAALGRAVRLLAAASAGPVSLASAPAGYAPLLSDTPRGDLDEEAWHLLFEASADSSGARLELDLSPMPPDAEAEAEALGADGEPTGVPLGELAGVANAFAAAALRAHARGNGLPPRELLPVPVVALSSAALRVHSVRDTLRLAAEAALRGERVVFPMLRDGRPAAGTSAARGASGGVVGGSAGACAGRVTLNLPRAARLAGRGGVEPFLRSCDELVGRAVDAHRARREYLAQAACAPGGPLASLFRGRSAREPLLSLGATSWSVGICGLNEALLALTGFELHEADDAVARTAERILSYLSLRVRSAGLEADLPVTLDADEDAAVARRFFESDLRQEPERILATLPSRTYTSGVAVRADAPVDFLLRVEREDPLHAHVATASLRLPVSPERAGGPDGLLALLGKCLEAGRCRQVEVGRW